MFNFLQIHEEIPSVSPDKLFEVAGWPISNSFLMSVLILVLFVLLGIYIKTIWKEMPNKAQSIIEIVYEWMVSLIIQITGDRKKAEAILPLIASLFLFIAVANSLSIVPGISSITYNGLPLFRTPTTDFNTTLGLALGMIVIINLISLRDYGFWGYVGKFVQVKDVVLGFRRGFKDGAMALVNFAIGLLDIISELAKIISLSLRLFGNVYAGEVLVVVLFGAVAYAVPGAWLMLSVLFGLVQAVVFGSLAAAYYAQARKP